MSERKLVGTGEMFRKALAGGYAIGAYNVNNMEILQGIAEAAEETFFRYLQVQENMLTKPILSSWLKQH